MTVCMVWSSVSCLSCSVDEEEDDDAAIAVGDGVDQTDNPVIDHHVGEHSFAVMEDDHDLRRKEQLDAKPRDESEAGEHARR